MQYKPFAGSDGFQLYIGDELIEDLVLPDTVTEIGSNQFSNCGSIRTATFGDAIRSVGDHAFAKCRRLQRITLLSAEPVTFGSGAFYEAPVVRFDYAGTQADYLNLRFGAEAFYLSNTWYIAYDATAKRSRTLSYRTVRRQSVRHSSAA